MVLILGIGHTELLFFGLTRFMEGFDKTPFLFRNLPLMPDIGVQLYELSQDFMAIMVLIASAIALARRWSGKIKRLMPRSTDGNHSLLYLGALCFLLWLNQYRNNLPCTAQ